VTTSGVITEYSLPSAGSYPIGITTGPDGNLWFAEYGPNSPTQNGTDNKIGVMRTDGTILHEYRTPTPASGPVDITTGPDGNLWFGEYSADKVGRVTTAGAFTEFAVPTPFGGPYGFVTGPDSNIWFTESLGKIAKILPS
jgi:virginiamycin B lyase